MFCSQLLEDLALQQTQLEQELEKVQQERVTNRARLLSYIYNGMTISDNTVKKVKVCRAVLFSNFARCKMRNLSNGNHSFVAEKEADNVIEEFLRNSEEERQSQAELLEREKQEEMRLLSSCHSEQFMLRTKDTLCEHRIKEYKLHVTSLFVHKYMKRSVLQVQWKSY